MKPQIIVCGLDDTGYKIFSLLKLQKTAVIGINPVPIPGEGEDVIVGDLRSPSTLLHAGVKEAHTLVIATSDDALNLAILAQARLLNSRIRIVNRLFNETLGERLDHTLPEHLSMSVSSLAAPIFAFAALGNRAIGQLCLFEQTLPIREEIIDEAHPWYQKELRELWEDPSQRLIHYSPASSQSNLVAATLNGERLQVGDHLVVGEQPTVRSQSRSRLLKMFKALANLQKYQQYVRPVTLVNLVLLLVIAIATFTYVCFGFNTSIVDALYFSVGMITGAGGQEKVGEMAPDSIKIFTSIMMIVGTGVIGICYALTNDFILGTRLGQFWDAARVPSRHHYVVCGLGIVGIQIIRQLHSQGCEVVAIESDPNNRFLPVARSLGVPVIVENACFDDALKAANIDRAESLIAVTSKDMVNVDIALTAKAMVPKLSIVLRVHDSQFARSVQEVFEFETVLCPTDIATPSFVAAALGGRILGNGITRDLLWVALAIVVTPGHPFCGKIVKDAAIKADFVPLHLESYKQNIQTGQLLDAHLYPQDILYLVMPAAKLKQLHKTESSQNTNYERMWHWYVDKDRSSDTSDNFVYQVMSETPTKTIYCDSIDSCSIPPEKRTCRSVSRTPINSV